jgi:hypothetical protein
MRVHHLNNVNKALQILEQNNVSIMAQKNQFCTFFTSSAVKCIKYIHDNSFNTLNVNKSAVLWM